MTESNPSSNKTGDTGVLGVFLKYPEFLETPLHALHKRKRVDNCDLLSLAKVMHIKYLI
ncbi:MAG: hypothetical protein JEZ12_02585 [Desulfobacterium sp.]|nr:hypothetical protein [Desulfobacterium sp.]